MATNKLSKKGLSRAVLKAAAQSPFTVYPTAVGLISTMGMLMFGPVAAGVAAVGYSAAALGWLIEYGFNRDKHSRRFLKAMREKMDAEREHSLETLEQDLKQMGADKALNQLALFNDKFDNFQSVLEKRFDPMELTYARYLAIAEQVYLAGLDNLEQIYLSMKSVSALSVDNIEQQLEQLRHESGHADEIDALEKRLALFSEQQQRSDTLLRKNEIALTEIDNVTTKLANSKTQRGHADTSMDVAMDELADLAKRTAKYAIH